MVAPAAREPGSTSTMEERTECGSVLVLDGLVVLILVTVVVDTVSVVVADVVLLSGLHEYSKQNFGAPVS